MDELSSAKTPNGPNKIHKRVNHIVPWKIKFDFFLVFFMLELRKREKFRRGKWTELEQRDAGEFVSFPMLIIRPCEEKKKKNGCGGISDVHDTRLL